MDKADGNVPNGRRYSVSPFRLFSVFLLAIIALFLISFFFGKN